MKYLITGAAGFIGYNFVKSCNKRRIKTVSVDTPEAFARHQDTSVFGSLVSRDHLPMWLYNSKTDLKLDAIIHLGACSDTTELDAAYLAKVNSGYSQQLWEYCTYNKIPFIYASSAATYGSGRHGYSDNPADLHKLRPMNLYGKSKHEFDLWATDGDNYGFCPPRWIGFKFFNVYGSGEEHKGKMASIVYQFYHQIRETGKVKLFKSENPSYANGYQARDFIYVQDIVRVLQWAASPKNTNLQRGIFNLGTGVARSYLDVAWAVFKAMKKNPAIEFVDMPKELIGQYQYFTQADMDRLKSIHPALDFFTLEQGVRKYVKEMDNKPCPPTPSSDILVVNPEQ